MSPDKWSEIETLYHAALERDPAERLAFLKRTCADDELRQEVESLLEHVQEGDWLLESRPWESEPALHIGTRLGPYEIVSMIGSGGMGKVYQAIDTRLDRTVAIKVTTRQFAETFEPEARAIAALNHPHVSTLYDVGPNYLVMELVEGETLAARLHRGPLTAQTVARYGADIADALAAAHARGIMHCDLKPGNILLSKTGVKVLDFGIAKFLRAGDARDSQNSTSDGRIVGTLAYMAPEQLALGQCDERSDIYSLGLVLAEMLTAKQVSETPARADREQEGQIFPNITETPLDRIIRKCLAKDPEERWQSARDLKTILDWALQPYEEHQKSRSSKMLGRGISAATVALAATIGWFFLPGTDPLPSHFLLSPPEGTRIALRMPTKTLAAVAPDGHGLVLIAEDDAGKRSLWFRRLDSTEYQHLDQTDGASIAFWSPDSQFVGFFSDGKLKKIPASGGATQTICTVGRGDGEGATWSRNGVIVFAPPRPEAAALPTGALNWVSVAGGAIKPATTLDKENGELSHSWPQFLPDGRFLYLARNKDPEKSAIYVQEVGSTERQVLLASKTQATYARGPGGQPYLLLTRDRALEAQPLDLGRLRLYGEPVAVATEIRNNTLYGTSAFSVSDNGVLAYRSGVFSTGSSPIRQLVWYNRRGDRLNPVVEPGLYRQIALSPDETRVAVDRNVHENDLRYWDIWIIELTRGILSRLTQGPNFGFPVWSADSRKIAAVSQVGDRQDLVEIPLASAIPSVVLSDQDPKLLENWTPDGRFLMFSTSLASFRLPMTGTRKPQPMLSSSVYKGGSKVSPDGRWIAYHSTESGRSEVYVRSFPALDQKRQISNGGGIQPLWSRDGKELFYLTLNAKLMAADVRTGPSLELSNSKLLFQTPIEGNPVLSQYAVASAGQRFLMVENARNGGASGIEEFHVIINLFSGLKTHRAGRK